LRAARRVSTMETISCAPVRTAVISIVFIECDFAVAMRAP
jgi:hypothetical protein